MAKSTFYINGQVADREVIEVLKEKLKARVRTIKDYGWVHEIFVSIPLTQLDQELVFNINHKPYRMNISKTMSSFTINFGEGQNANFNQGGMVMWDDCHKVTCDSDDERTLREFFILSTFPILDSREDLDAWEKVFDELDDEAEKLTGYDGEKHPLHYDEFLDTLIELETKWQLNKLNERSGC